MPVAFRRLKDVLTDFRRPPLPEAPRLPGEALARARVTGAATFLVGGLLAFLWANTTGASSYFHFRNLPVAAEWSGLRLALTLRGAVNEGLMTLYFFSIALAARRRIGGWTDESRARVIVPSLAAAGLFIVPAILARILAGPSFFRASLALGGLDLGLALASYAVARRNVDGQHPFLIFSTAIDAGWIVSLFFFCGRISWWGLGVFAAVYLGAFAVRAMGARGAAWGIASGVAVWLAFRQTGFFPALAGVLISTLVPAVSDTDERKITELAEDALDDYDRAMDDADGERCSAVAERLGSIAARAQPPIDRWQKAALSWLTWLILPLFGWVNGGISLGDISAFGAPTVLAAAWFIGRPAGVLLFGGLALRRWREPGSDAPELSSLALVSCAGGVPVVAGALCVFPGAAADPYVLFFMAASLIGAMAGGGLLVLTRRGS